MTVAVNRPSPASNCWQTVHGGIRRLLRNNALRATLGASLIPAAIVPIRNAGWLQLAGENSCIDTWALGGALLGLMGRSTVPATAGAGAGLLTIGVNPERYPPKWVARYENVYRKPSAQTQRRRSLTLYRETLGPVRCLITGGVVRVKLVT
jgi:hypothetical protein